MRIWITGASGSLGQELVPRLSGNFESAEICFPTSSELDLENFEDVSSFDPLTSTIWRRAFLV